jgi:hypothetical protein
MTWRGWLAIAALIATVVIILIDFVGFLWSAREGFGFLTWMWGIASSLMVWNLKRQVDGWWRELDEWRAEIARIREAERDHDKEV